MPATPEEIAEMKLAADDIRRAIRRLFMVNKGNCMVFVTQLNTWPKEIDLMADRAARGELF